MDWRPIETALKDEDAPPIIVLGNNEYEMAVVVWEPVHDSWACAWDGWPLEAFAAKYWQPAPKVPFNITFKQDLTDM